MAFVPVSIGEGGVAFVTVTINDGGVAPVLVRYTKREAWPLFLFTTIKRGVAFVPVSLN